MEASEFILAHKGWLVTVARHIAGSTLAEAEDLIQEGSIKIWQVMNRFPGQRDYYYLKAAKRRMEDVAYNFYPMMGEESRDRRAAKEFKQKMDYLDRPFGEDTILADVIPSKLDVEDHAIAYHQEVIYNAIRKLTQFQRRSVFRRFWLLDLEPDDARDWQRIKPKLASELKGLASLV